MERCVDASLSIKWALLDEPNRPEALALLGEAVSGDVLLIAPMIWLYEVDSIIRKSVKKGRITPKQGRDAYELMDTLPIQIIEDPVLRSRAREIAEQFDQTFVYDSIYAALAELRGCELWTADLDFYKAVRSGLPFVRYLTGP